MKLFLLFVSFLWITGLSAQSLGEDPYIRFYLGRSIQRTKLFYQTGLGKFIMFRNIPDNWIKEYQRSNALEDVQGLFGAVENKFSFVKSRSFLVDFKGSDMGELDMSLRANLEFKKLTGKFSVNGHWQNQRNDRNNDNFLDLPLKKRILAHNSWEVFFKNFTSVNQIWVLGLQTQDGQSFFNKEEHYMTTNAYGTGSDVVQVAGESSNYIKVRKKDLVLFHIQALDHSQQDFYGLRKYKAKEWGIGSKLQYNYRLDNGNDMFIIGLNYNYRSMIESIDSIDNSRQESFGGGFLGYETFFGKNIKLSSRINVTHHNLAQWIVVPHVRFDAKLHKYLIANLFGGSGMRYANVLSENSALLFSNREVDIPEILRHEQAWYYGASLQYGNWINLGWDLYTFLNFQFYHTIYQNKIITDLDSDPYKMIFTNLNGHAEKLSFEMDVQLRLARPQMGLNIDYRMDFVYSTIAGQYSQEPLYSMHNLLLAFDYRIIINRLYVCDITTQLHYQGPKRLPDVTAKMTSSNPFPNYSPDVYRWNMKISFPFYKWMKGNNKTKNFIFYFGVDNILNSVQNLQDVSSFEPFNNNFDAGLRYNTFTGRRFYGGFTYRF